MPPFWLTPVAAAPPLSLPNPNADAGDHRADHRDEAIMALQMQVQQLQEYRRDIGSRSQLIPSQSMQSGLVNSMTQDIASINQILIGGIVLVLFMVMLIFIVLVQNAHANSTSIHHLMQSHQMMMHMMFVISSQNSNSVSQSRHHMK